MSLTDWCVLAATLGAIIAYGMYRGRKARSIEGFLLADHEMKWYTVALSIMATQASAITFTSTPGQGFADGLRFVQFYFGLPLAMVILSITAVPIFHRLKVYTAYEFLEHRFDLRTRTLTTIIFLIQRGLGAGFTIYAPSLILSVVLGWDSRVTSTLIGAAIILYTTTGGVKSVQWTHFQQMLVILFGMLLALILAVNLLPRDVTFGEALHVAGVMGKLDAVDFSFDLKSRYNIWSGLIGGMFVALAYFGTDQSQVQRYLTGRSITQSRLGLLFNGIVKIPMQFMILLIGVMVFSFYQFVQPPIFFNRAETSSAREGVHADDFLRLESEQTSAFAAQTRSLSGYLAARENGSIDDIDQAKKQFLADQQRLTEVRKAAKHVIVQNNPGADTNDSNYVFLTFIVDHLPVGIIGLLFACILAASMSSSSGELSALATSSVVDIYKRHFKQDGSEKHYLIVSRIAMAVWGVYAIGFAQLATRLGSLIEAVNVVGSLFYGTMLAIFLIAFYMKWVRGPAVFWSAFAGEAVVLWAFFFTGIPWLWYNVLGCGVVILVALALNAVMPQEREGPVTSTGPGSIP